jgi:hypothetical protein
MTRTRAARFVTAAVVLIALLIGWTIRTRAASYAMSPEEFRDHLADELSLPRLVDTEDYGLSRQLVIELRRPEGRSREAGAVAQAFEERWILIERTDGRGGTLPPGIGASGAGIDLSLTPGVLLQVDRNYDPESLRQLLAAMVADPDYLQAYVLDEPTGR